MKILPVESGPVYTLGYLVIDETSQKGVIIDTPLDSTDFFAENIAEGIEITAIILTHSHWDHTADCPKIKKLTNAPIYIHKHDEYRIKNPYQHTIWKLPFELESFNADSYLADGYEIESGSLKFKISHTPGHTEGSICLVEENEKIVFTGDTLFNLSVGRTDLPGGNSEQLMNSINEKLLILPDDCILFSGHGDSSTIGTERKFNPFIRR